jgi:hypothetical protein
MDQLVVLDLMVLSEPNYWIAVIFLCYHQNCWKVVFGNSVEWLMDEVKVLVVVGLLLE